MNKQDKESTDNKKHNMKKMSGRKPIVSLVLTSIILLSTLSSACRSSTTVYTNDEAGFSLSYPRSWQKAPADSKSNEVFVLTSDQSRIRVRVFGEGERPPFFALEPWFKKAIADAYPGSKLVSFKQTTLADRVTPCAEIKWQRPDGSGELQLMDLYVYIGGKIALIQSSSPLGDWAKNEDTFQKLIGSVRVTASNEPPGPALPAIAGEKPKSAASGWKWQEVEVPMADGKALATSVRIPQDNTKRYPTVLIQTPYGKHWFVNEPGTYLPFISDDYAYVVVDIRGYYASADAGERWTTAGMDGYSAVEWVAAQSWSDGKVGTWGPSALGAVQFSTAISQPPHLVCAVPVIRNLRNDYPLYFPGGVFREAYNDTISLAVGLPRKTPSSYPTAGWDVQGVASLTASFINIPMLFIGGWYDHHTLPEGYGIIQSYRDVQTSGGPNARGNQRLVIGPWTHTDYDKLDQGQLQYTNAEGLAGDEAKLFFDYWLRGIDNAYSTRPPIRYYLNGYGPMAGHRCLATSTGRGGCLLPAGRWQIIQGEAGGLLARHIPFQPRQPRTDHRWSRSILPGWANQKWPL